LALLARPENPPRPNRLCAEGWSALLRHFISRLRGSSLGIAGSISLLCAIAAQAQSAPEYQVKAAFLFNFAKFVEWPSNKFPSADAPLQICIFGQGPFGVDFERVIAGKSVSGHTLQISYPTNTTEARTCHILFIPSTQKKKMQQILDSLKGASVLTVADTEGFAQMGGDVNFVLDDDRVRFEINLKATDAEHLKLSAKLLAVAKTVIGREGSATQ